MNSPTSKRGLDVKTLPTSALQDAAQRVADQRKAMIGANRAIANATWTDKALTAEERTRYTDACRALGLNPALGHAEIMGGRIYVTHKGLLHLLNSGGYEWEIHGAAVTEGPDHEFWCEREGQYVWRATIEARRVTEPGRKWRYTDFGVAHPSEFDGPHKVKIRAPQMAKKRAEHRAIRAILEIDIPSVDEMYAETFVPASYAHDAQPNLLGEIPLEPVPTKQVEAPRQTLTIEKPDIERLLRTAEAAGVNVEDVFSAAGRMVGKTITGTHDLAALDEKTIETLTQEIAAFGPEPEVTR